jgi:flavin-dependent thymidylate synthase
MKVTLLSYTRDAMDLLIFTKNTRLTMSPSGMDDISNWTLDRKYDELDYMANTIPSSWEFIDYVFMIEGVTRAFTHQLVRTRHASFAQQTMRVLDVSEGDGWSYGTGPSIVDNHELNSMYSTGMKVIANCYKALVEKGAKREDARGILPTNILTNIVMKIDMRNFVDMIHKRSSPRVQGEYRQALDQMKAVVLDVHPWVAMFIDRTFDQAALDLDDEIADIEDSEKRTRMMKLVDQLRSK